MEYPSVNTFRMNNTSLIKSIQRSMTPNKLSNTQKSLRTASLHELTRSHAGNVSTMSSTVKANNGILLRAPMNRQAGEDLELELSHMNNLDMWRITTCEKLRGANMREHNHYPILSRISSTQAAAAASHNPTNPHPIHLKNQKNNYAFPSSQKQQQQQQQQLLLQKQKFAQQQQKYDQQQEFTQDKTNGPKIKMDILDNIMQHDDSTSFDQMNPTMNYLDSGSKRKMNNNEQEQQNQQQQISHDSHQQHQQQQHRFQEQNSQIPQQMQQLGSTKKLSLRKLNPGSNQEFIRSESNKIVIHQIVTNKLKSIFKATNKIDVAHVDLERPRIENTLKNFKNLRMTLNQTQFNLQTISEKLIEEKALSSTKVFDFSTDLKRIELEKLDFVAKEHRIFERLQSLTHSAAVTKENKRLFRAFIFEVSHKLRLFNVNIPVGKFLAIERVYVQNYFYDNRRTENQSIHISEMKSKLSSDENFLKFIEKLREAKSKEVKEYTDTQAMLENIIEGLKEAYQGLKSSSHEIKENYTKGRASLRDMYFDLISQHLDIFLQSHNASWIARGFAMIGEPLPLHRLPRYLDEISINYIKESGRILLEIQRLDERKPKSSVALCNETERIIEMIKNAVDTLNASPLLSNQGQRVLNYHINNNNNNNNFNSQMSMTRLSSFFDFGAEEQQSQASNSIYVNMQVESISPHEQHYKSLATPTHIQALLSDTNEIEVAIQKLLPNQNIHSNSVNDASKQRHEFLDQGLEKKQKELSSQLLHLKRQEIARLIEGVTSKNIKHEAFNLSVEFLFGRNETDKSLQNYLLKQQLKSAEIPQKNVPPLKSIEVHKRAASLLNQRQRNLSNSNSNSNSHTSLNSGLSFFQQGMSINSTKEIGIRGDRDEQTNNNNKGIMTEKHVTFAANRSTSLHQLQNHHNQTISQNSMRGRIGLDHFGFKKADGILSHFYV